MDRFAVMGGFVAVVETRSFSAAARRTRLSKSLLSRQITALETELGARLFHRTTRSVTLTEAGQRYYESAVRILAEVAEADRSVSQLQALPRGVLRVNAPMSFGFLHLAPAIPEFLARFPDIEIDMTMNDRFVDLVEEGFDVAVRLGRLPDSSLVARRLASARRAICASPAYLATHGIPATPWDLVSHNCLCYSELLPSEEWRFIDAGEKPFTVTVRGRLRANNGDALRAAALKGLGIAYLPTFMLGDDLRSGSLVSVLTEFVPTDGAVHAVYPTARHLSSKVRAFVDFLAEKFGETPYWDVS